MSIESKMSDKSILGEIGQRLNRCRIDMELTQADLAREAGISKRTVERMEAGESTQLTNLIRVMRVLDLLDGLNATLPDRGPRPMDLLKLHGKQRRRVATRKVRKPGDSQWTWGDDA